MLQRSKAICLRKVKGKVKLSSEIQTPAILSFSHDHFFLPPLDIYHPHLKMLSYPSSKERTFWKPFPLPISYCLPPPAETPWKQLLLLSISTSSLLSSAAHSSQAPAEVANVLPVAKPTEGTTLGPSLALLAASSRADDSAL